MKTLLITLILCFSGALSWAQNVSTSTNVKGYAQSTQTISTYQEVSRFQVNREIFFQPSSEEESITIDVPKDTKRFSLEINGEIIQGKFAVEVIDPDGNKKGNFTLSTQVKPGSKERVNGHYQKELNEPPSGTWIIRISPTGANGKISIKSGFIEENN